MIPERTNQSKQGLHEFCQFLSNKLGGLSDKRICELGSWTGCSAEIFASYFGQVVCIDRWESGDKSDISSKYRMSDVEKIFDERAEKNQNIVKMRGDSASELSKFDNGYFDIIYVDADHSYNGAKRDIEIALKKGKLITGHDYSGKFPGVMKAVNEYFTRPFKVFKESSWISRSI
jgi:predicted O-methyltransferase YrrM